MFMWNFYIFVLFPMVVDGCIRTQWYSVTDTDIDLHNITFSALTSQSRSLLHCAMFCTEDVCCGGFFFDSSQRQCTEILVEGGNRETYQQNIYETGFKLYWTGCDYGWIEHLGHCYFLGPSKLTWDEAKVACLEFCSHLVEIESKEESEWLAQTFLERNTCSSYTYSDCSSWTGGNDLQTEGHYVWDGSNSTFTFTYWHHDQPSVGMPDHAARKDCIDILRNGGWNDRSCSYQNSYICEKSLF